MACADPQHGPHAPCAVCNDAYGTRFICAECRADPANCDWLERGQHELLDGDVEITQQRPLDVPREVRAARLERDVLDALRCRTIRVPYRVRFRRNGRRQWGWRWCSRSLTLREIAWLVGCSHTRVHQIFRSIFAP